jgi:hypothetical protein
MLDNERAATINEMSETVRMISSFAPLSRTGETASDQVPGYRISACGGVITVTEKPIIRFRQR